MHFRRLFLQPALCAAVVLTLAGQSCRAVDGWEQLMAKGRTWWSFQPIQDPAPPQAKQADWSSHPVDQFLLAKMEEHGLGPSVDADAAAMGRRLHFLLTGLPPSISEAEGFAKVYAESPGVAVSRKVDELLASPRFGERMARRWMDLVRYAETHGSEGDPDIPDAWRYRDYLIRAFNEDVPLDQLIREHVAGDLLEKPRWHPDGWNESMLGAAHLRLVEHGFQPVDSLDEQIKTLDSQIDVLGKAFQALTLSCARCHDHKFDPVSQRDYYGLAGVLASVRPAQVTIDAPERLMRNREELLRLKQEIRLALSKLWRDAAEKIPARLLHSAERADLLVNLRKELSQEEKFLAVLEARGRGAALAKRGEKDPAPSALLPEPALRWSFQNGLEESLGGIEGELIGGAVIRNGRLVLNGQDAAYRSGPLRVDLLEKTFEAWVSLTTLDQGGGGVVSVEKQSGGIFDSLVFAERDARQWLVGSDSFRRTQPLGGPVEQANGEFVQMAISYHADGIVRCYRNGMPYGREYRAEGPVHFPRRESRILLGQRHTGGGRAFLSGEIEEARVYGKALTPEEVRVSYLAGVERMPETEWVAALNETDRAELDQRRASRRIMLEKLAAAESASAELAAWGQALSDAGGDLASPLHAWTNLAPLANGEMIPAAEKLRESLQAAWDDSRKFNAENFLVGWDLGDDGSWFGHGPGVAKAQCGEFSIMPEGDRILDAILPAGRWTNSQSTRHNGILVSPRFKLEAKNLSVRVWGGGGARVRLIVDNYPLGNNGTYPQARLEKNTPQWIRFDTTYRHGSWAYLEFATESDQTRGDGGSGAERSWFGVEKVVFHEQDSPPREERRGSLPVLEGGVPRDRAELAERMRKLVLKAVAAWEEGNVSEESRELLDFFVRKGLMPSGLGASPTLAGVVEKYRALEREIPTARRAPGVLETVGFEVPVLTRGDHHKPGELAPRRYLEMLGSWPFASEQSGRQQLAEALIDSKNPLTARVMANRLWLWAFGRGLAPTPDDFGRMGEKPTHPELLDHLASRLIRDKWSAKSLLRFLLTSRTFRLASSASGLAVERDPGNDWLSHFTVRRMEAEELRDTLVLLAGQLDLTPGGPGQNGNAPPDQQRRRSVYLTIRRTSLNPFLETFDSPKPFSTVGRRSVTTVPAQSLTLLNDPFVLHCAQRWAEREARELPQSTVQERVRRMFFAAMGRPPSEAEIARCLKLVLSGEKAAPTEADWRDFGQSLFNLKEFLYLR